MVFGRKNPNSHKPLTSALSVIFKNLVVYTKNFGNLTIKVRPFYAPEHLKLMHRWSSLPYASHFWQMKMSFRKFRQFYLERVNSLKGVVFLLYLNEVPVAQVDVYQVSSDELSAFTETGNDDYGFHLLMAPYRELLAACNKETRGLAEKVIITVLEMLFHISDASRVYAEPDINNIHSCRLAERTGFVFIKEIEMSYKKANLYCISKEMFNHRYPPPDWLRPTRQR